MSARRPHGAAPCRLALPLAAVALAVSCGAEPIADPRRDLLTDYGDWLLAHYDAAIAGADALVVAVDTACAAPSTRTLQGARAAWAAARAPLQEAEVFAFGPYTEEPIRLGPQLDFWPTRTEVVAALLTTTGPVDATLLGAPQKGLGAIEWLLWAPGLDGVAALGEARRCEVLAALTRDLGRTLRALRDAWAPDAGDALGELTEASLRPTRYGNLQMTLGEVVNRVGYLFENLRADKVGRPWGLLGDDGPDPEARAARFSGRTFDDLRDNLVGARALLLGGESGPGRCLATDTARCALGQGLDGYLRQRGRFLGPLLRPRFDAALAAVDALAAAPDDTAAAQAVFDRLGELQRAVQADVLGALSVTVGFNDADGD